MATIKGVWVWNASVNFTNSYSYLGLSYTSNNTTFNTLSVDVIIGDTSIKYNDAPVYHNGWGEDAHRTIDFGTTKQECPDGFYTEFTANAKSESSGGDTPTTPEPEEPDTPTGTKTIKKGTYRWNDDLTIPSDWTMVTDTPPVNTLYQELTFTNNDLTYALIVVQEFNGDDAPSGLIVQYKPTTDQNIEDGEQVYIDGEIAVEVGISSGWQDALYKVFSVPIDTDVSDIFATWFNANTNPVSSGGETPDTPDTPDTETPTVDSLKAKIQNLINKANTTTGKSDTDLTSGVNSLIAGYGQGGGSTECDGCIIEVDTLPTENIDENVLYKVGDSYYKYAQGFRDVVYVQNGSVIHFTEMIQEQGGSVELISVDNYESVTDPHPFDQSIMSVPLYYDASRNDVYLYFRETWIPFSTMNGTTNGGAITNTSQAITEGYHYALFGNTWAEFTISSGVLKIIENGSYDVAEVASVTVDIPNEAVVGVWRFNDTPNMYPYPVTYQAVNFISNSNDDYVGIGFASATSTGYEIGYYESYRQPTSTSIVAYTSNNGWHNEDLKTIDFGAEPQIVTSAFKEWLVANATYLGVDVQLNGVVTADEGYDGLSKVTVAVPDPTTIPDKVVFYNNMNGREVKKITPIYTMYNGTEHIESNDFLTSSTWTSEIGSKAVAVFDTSTKEGNAIRLHDTRDAVKFPCDNGFEDDGLSGFTMGAWIRWSGSNNGYQRMFSTYGVGGMIGLYIYQSTLNIDGGNAAGTYTIDMSKYKNNWVHLAFTVVKSSGSVYVKIYVNGLLIGSSNTNITNTSRTFISFHDGSGYYFKGSMKNTFLSRGALTESEIRQMMFVD